MDHVLLISADWCVALALKINKCVTTPAYLFLDQNHQRNHRNDYVHVPFDFTFGFFKNAFLFSKLYKMMLL
jgi:hypothetical protein